MTINAKMIAPIGTNKYCCCCQLKRVGTRVLSHFCWESPVAVGPWDPSSQLDLGGELLSTEGVPGILLTFARDDAKGVADYLSKCARICLHQQRASPALQICSNMSKNQVLKEEVGLLWMVLLQMVRECSG